MARPRQNEFNDERGERETNVEKVVFINRCAKVVKGGRRFSFSALMVTGDRKGNIGIGFGKANEVSDAIRKGTEAANKRMIPVPLAENTIPHEVIGEFGGGRIMLRPAAPGTGIIAGGGVRAVMEAAGIRDILTKSLGSSNPSNVVKATVAALSKLQTREEIYKLRGKPLKPRFKKEEVLVVETSEGSEAAKGSTGVPLATPDSSAVEVVIETPKAEEVIVVETPAVEKDSTPSIESTASQSESTTTAE